MTVSLSATDVRICEACWAAPVRAVRHVPGGRDLLCRECAEGNYPRRVDLFPPYGIYGMADPRTLTPAVAHPGGWSG
ncbi:hypothetical protein [Streptomyces microflavus]|uniref:hypothetical protein n=1 Tax=Streptomyces microflavus TaxID=1919 RepID=UPI0033ADA392